MAAPRPQLEVADVIRAHGQEFLNAMGGSVTLAQERVLRDLAACRTAALGGHIEECTHCGHERPAYDSCLMGSAWLWEAQRLTLAPRQHVNWKRSP